MKRDEAAELIKGLSLEEKLKLYELLRRIEDERETIPQSAPLTAPFAQGSLAYG